MAYSALVDNFDHERGNRLTIPLETATELTTLPCEIAAPIIYGLLSWFAGGDVPTLPDPRDNATLQRLVVHQKENAAHYAEVLATKRANRMGKGRQETPATESGENARQRPSTGATDKTREDKSSVSKDLSCHAAGASSRAAGASPAAGVSADASPADHKTVTAVYCDGMDGREVLWLADPKGYAAAYNGMKPLYSHSVTDDRFKADPVSVLAGYPVYFEGENAKEKQSSKAKFRNALRQRFNADPKQFCAIAWQFLKDAHNARGDFIKAVLQSKRCGDCHLDFCYECPHENLRQLVVRYEDDFGSDNFVKNLLGRLKVLKPKK